MFNLDRAIGEWRQELRGRGIKGSETLDELESHLRDDVEQETRSGCNLERAFEAAVSRMGQISALQGEFQKIRITESIRRLIHVIRVLAGIPNYDLVTNMNTSCINPNVEARWATYAKAAAFLTPALSLWIFSCVFLMPKLKQIANNASLALPTLLQITLFLSSHFVLISATLVLSLVFLEWRSNRWPRYRRTTLGVSIFLINTLVLLVITLMVFSALLAAPAIAHVSK
jgi:hypothetical protein